jgi:hypothetical protein
MQSKPTDKESRMSNLVRRPSFLGVLSSDRATGKALSAVQTGAFVERARDVARRDLTIGRLSDTGAAIHHALEEGDNVVRDLEQRVEGRPFALAALGPLAEKGMHDLGRILDDLSGGF